jgi:diketogulonate reductase-like aldo/keto reductase
MIAFSPFGSPDLPWGEKLPHILVDPAIQAIADEHKRSPAQVVLRWLLQRGLATIPKVTLIIYTRGSASQISANHVVKKYSQHFVTI